MKRILAQKSDILAMLPVGNTAMRVECLATDGRVDGYRIARAAVSPDALEVVAFAVRDSDSIRVILALLPATVVVEWANGSVTFQGAT